MSSPVPTSFTLSIPTTGTAYLSTSASAPPSVTTYSARKRKAELINHAQCSTVSCSNPAFVLDKKTAALFSGLSLQDFMVLLSYYQTDEPEEASKDLNRSVSTIHLMNTFLEDHFELDGAILLRIASRYRSAVCKGSFDADKIIHHFMTCGYFEKPTDSDKRDVSSFVACLAHFTCNTSHEDFGDESDSDDSDDDDV